MVNKDEIAMCERKMVNRNNFKNTYTHTHTTVEYCFNKVSKFFHIESSHSKHISKGLVIILNINHIILIL